MRKILSILLIILMVCLPSWARKQKATPQPDAAQVLLEQEFKYYFYQAVEAFLNSHYDDAFALFKHCEAIVPDDAAVANYLSLMYGAMNQPDIALAYAKRAYHHEPLSYWQNYANRLLHSEDSELQKQGMKVLEHICQLDHNADEAFDWRQQLYMHQGNAKMALRMQDELDRINGKTPYGALQRYSILQNQGKFKQADAVIDEYLRYEPENYYFQNMRASMYLQSGDTAAAYEQLNYIRRHYPENPYLNLAFSNYFSAKNDLQQAQHYAMMAIDNEAADADYKLELLKTTPALRFDSVQLKAIKSIVRQHPQSEPAWQKLFDLLSSDSTITDDDYERYARTAITFVPENKQWYYIMSLLMWRKQDTDSAIIFAKQGLKQTDGNEITNYRFALTAQLADIYAAQEQIDSALCYYEKALAIMPENIYVLNNYAWMLATNGGDLRKAEKMSQTTIQKEPNNATYLDTYAWILHLQGQEFLAKFYIQKAWENLENKNDQVFIQHYLVICGTPPNP